MCGPWAAEPDAGRHQEQEANMKTLVRVCLPSVDALSLTVCNAAVRVGRHLEAGGQAITNAADKAAKQAIR